MWKIKVTVIPVVVEAIEMVPKNMGKRLDNLDIWGRIETIYVIYMVRKYSTNCFFSNPKILSLRFRCVTSLTFPIWDFYFDISEWHILSARPWTPALMLHLNNPCPKRKFLILTKPKGKIYKIKSLRNYITFRPQHFYNWIGYLVHDN